MGLLDSLNVKKKLAMLNDVERPTVEVRERKTPTVDGIFERSAIDFPRLVAPEAVDWKPDYYQVGDEFCRTLFVHTFPPAVEDNWLAPILRFQHAVRHCALHPAA